MNTSADRIQAPVALVTGASSGIGKVMAEALAAHGHRVFGTSRHPERSVPVTNVQLVAMDVDSDASVERAVAEVLAQAGRLDMAVCNAGFGIMGAIEDTATEHMIAQFQTNVFGVHRVCRAVLPHLRRRETARLVVTGSLAGLTGLPFQGMYSASKFALEGYCEALRLELRDSPVRVSLIEPGDFPTGFTGSRRFIPDADMSAANRVRMERVAAIVEADESNGGDLSLLADAILRIARDPQPPLRNLVAAADQMEFVGTVRPGLSPDQWEGFMAEHFGLDPA